MKFTSHMLNPFSPCLMKSDVVLCMYFPYHNTTGMFSKLALGYTGVYTPTLFKQELYSKIRAIMQVQIYYFDLPSNYNTQRVVFVLNIHRKRYVCKISFIYVQWVVYMFTSPTLFCSRVVSLHVFISTLFCTFTGPSLFEVKIGRYMYFSRYTVGKLSLQWLSRLCRPFLCGNSTSCARPCNYARTSPKISIPLSLDKHRFLIC